MSDMHKVQQHLETFKQHIQDSGSMECQIVRLHFAIKELTEHLKTHKKDFTAQRSIMRWVAKLNSCKKYLNKHNPTKYSTLIQALGMRK
jgi:small subunit ribosomal protein S15